MTELRLPLNMDRTAYSSMYVRCDSISENDAELLAGLAPVSMKTVFRSDAWRSAKWDLEFLQRYPKAKYHGDLDKDLYEAEFKLMQLELEELRDRVVVVLRNQLHRYVAPIVDKAWPFPDGVWYSRDEALGYSRVMASADVDIKWLRFLSESRVCNIGV